MSIAVTKANFEQEVLQSDLPVLVDFWAYWCGPCMAQTPILNEIIMERPNQMKICKVNIDEEFQLVSDYPIDSIPHPAVLPERQAAEKAGGCPVQGDHFGLAEAD